jgi:prepilin-type N-terminal cleavage/methylation domain-containing protein
MKEPPQLYRQSLSNAAFSLLELLLVVAILVVITTLYWNHGPSRRERDLSSCQANLEKIYLAMEIYAQDSKGKFPVTTNALTSEEALALLVPHYTSDTAMFICPATKSPLLPADKSFRDWKISYAYYMGRRPTDSSEALMSDEQVNTHSKGQGALVFSDTGKPPGSNHGKEGGNFLACDGSVVSSSNTAPFSLTLTQSVVLLNPKP